MRAALIIIPHHTSTHFGQSQFASSSSMFVFRQTLKTVHSSSTSFNACVRPMLVFTRTLKDGHRRGYHPSIIMMEVNRGRSWNFCPNMEAYITDTVNKNKKITGKKKTWWSEGRFYHHTSSYVHHKHHIPLPDVHTDTHMEWNSGFPKWPLYSFSYGCSCVASIWRSSASSENTHVICSSCCCS